MSQQIRRGFLASQYGGEHLELEVLKSAAGYYIGTFDPEEGPFSRESDCYWATRAEAEAALATDDWPQKPNP